jgi:hypothetical protein
MQLMLQATVCDCLARDPLAFEEHGLSAPEVDVSPQKMIAVNCTLAACPPGNHGL